MDQRLEKLSIAAGKIAARNPVNRDFQFQIGTVDFERAIALFLARLYFGHAQVEQKKFPAPISLRIPMFALSSVPIVNTPFKQNFMLPIPEASLPAIEICPENPPPDKFFGRFWH
jgi:hypothetical protein